MEENQAPTPTSVYPITLHRVKDGDTIVANRMDPETYRLAGIDALETRGKNITVAHKLAAMAATNFLISVLSNATEILVETDNDKTDNFGRILATIYADGVNVNELLVRKGYAKETS